MKTSQNLNKVLDKLPKTELKSEKVELSLISDLMTSYNALVKVKDVMDENLSKAKKSAIMGDTGVKNFNELFKNIETASKALGVPVKDANIQKLVAEVKQFTNDFDNVIKA